jgi:hypothetical protein
MLMSGHVPDSFGLCYTVPIPKVKDTRTRALKVDDFRGIGISSILSKIFEHCTVDRFQSFLHTADNQFGFKRGAGCRDAVYAVRRLVDHFVDGGSTVNICSIDLSKAFDKVNHHALLLKLMSRKIPLSLLKIIESWYFNCWTYIKWKSTTSLCFKVNYGVRQGSVLSPFFFALYIDDIVKSLELGQQCFIIMYADDILLLAPSVVELQRIFSACESELISVDMAINASKSGCIRIGPRYNYKCANIVTSSGQVIQWVKDMRYLGIIIVSHVRFKCSIECAKRVFYCAANGIFGKVGRFASEEVTLQLLNSKCMPALLYGLEACNLNKTTRNSLDFPVMRFAMKLFKTSDVNVITECLGYFDIQMPSAILAIRESKFHQQNLKSENYLLNW